MKYLASLFMLLLATNSFSQENKIPLIKWGNQPFCEKAVNVTTAEQLKTLGCDQFVLEGDTFKVVAYGGLYIAVSFAIEGDYIVSETNFYNTNTDKRFLIDPSQWSVVYFPTVARQTSASVGSAPAADAEQIAKKLKKRARWANFLSTFAAGMSQQNSTFESSGTVYSNGHSGTYSASGTVTTPDYNAQNRAAETNRQRSADTARQSEKIEAQSLSKNTLFPKANIGGLVYLKRNKKAKYYTVLVNMPDAVFFFDFDDTLK